LIKITEYHGNLNKIAGRKHMQYQDYIEMVPGKRSGKPCIKGTRITVYDVLEWLALPMTIEEISEDYPEIKTEEILACLAFAASREHHLLTVAA
tara:strand:+ start:642 stop:923 length:282 start_codon:yes stop_codon:yes gene_type:complete